MPFVAVFRLWYLVVLQGGLELLGEVEVLREVAHERGADVPQGSEQRESVCRAHTGGLDVPP